MRVVGNVDSFIHLGAGGLWEQGLFAFEPWFWTTRIRIREFNRL